MGCKNTLFLSNQSFSIAKNQQIRNYPPPILQCRESNIRYKHRFFLNTPSQIALIRSPSALLEILVFLGLLELLGLLVFLGLLGLLELLGLLV